MSVDLFDDDETDTSEKEIKCQLASGDYDSPVRAGPARVKDAVPDSGPTGPLAKPRKPYACKKTLPWHRGSLPAGRSMPSSWAKEKSTQCPRVCQLP